MSERIRRQTRPHLRASLIWPRRAWNRVPAEGAHTLPGPRHSCGRGSQPETVGSAPECAKELTEKLPTEDLARPYGFSVQLEGFLLQWEQKITTAQYIKVNNGTKMS